MHVFIHGPQLYGTGTPSRVSSQVLFTFFKPPKNHVRASFLRLGDRLPGVQNRVQVPEHHVLGRGVQRGEFGAGLALGVQQVSKFCLGAAKHHKMVVTVPPKHVKSDCVQ